MLRFPDTYSTLGTFKYLYIFYWSSNMEKHPKKLLFTNKRKYNQLYQGFAVSTVTSGLTAMNGRVKVPQSGIQ